jgi:hypothetical protein
MSTGARNEGNQTMTTTILIATLFVLATAFAAGTIAATLRAYWPAVVALRNAGVIQPEVQEVRITRKDIAVRATGQLLHGDFTRRRSAARSRVLRAAA